MSIDFAVEKFPARERLFKLLSDLAWHPHHALARVAGNRYSARILELKRLGYRIQSMSLENDGKSYRLESLTPATPQPKRVKVLLSEAEADEIANGRLSRTARIAVCDALGSFRANRERL